MNPNGVLVRGGAMTITGVVSTVATPASAANNFASVGLNAGDTASATVGGAGALFVAGDLNVADNNASVGTLTVTGGMVTARTLYVAKSGTAAGTVVQYGGAVQQANNGATPGDWRIGGAGSASDAAAVGTYNLVGGSLNSGTANLQVGAYGTGTLFRQTGGTATVNGYLSIGRYVGSKSAPGRRSAPAPAR